MHQLHSNVLMTELPAVLSQPTSRWRVHAGEGEVDALWHAEGFQPGHGQNHWQLQGTCIQAHTFCESLASATPGLLLYYLLTPAPACVCALPCPTLPCPAMPCLAALGTSLRVEV